MAEAVGMNCGESSHRGWVLGGGRGLCGEEKIELPVAGFFFFFSFFPPFIF